MTPEAFVLENTALKAPLLVPEIRLHLADDAMPLWHKTEEELARAGLAPPFWAFAWAGGQALARHILDTPALVAGRTVLDVGSGSGIVALAAAMAGASRVAANEIDEFALAAIALNAEANGLAIAIESGDLLDGTADADLVLVGDLFYEKPLATRTLAYMRRARRAGADVLIGDPSRTYLPQDALTPIAVYSVPTPRALEDADVKRTTIWRLAGSA